MSVPRPQQRRADAPRRSLRELLHAALVAAEAPLHRGAVLRGWLVSPQLRAVWLYRLSAHFAAKGGAWNVLSKFFGLQLVHRYGCHLSPHARIGAGLSLPHPTAIVVGRGVVVGEGVTLYQGVTLGVRNKRASDYPVVEDGVTIYAGAVVIGGVRIGAHAAVPANAVVTADIPARVRRREAT